MTEALLAVCIQLSGKYLCDGGKSVVKVYSSVVDGEHTYRFGVVGKWDFIADGKSHPMNDWPEGSAYRATCTENVLSIEQLRARAERSLPCAGFADRIIYHTQLVSMGTDVFAFVRTESHHCSSGRIVEVSQPTMNCRK